MKINLNTHFEILDDEMIRNLGLLVFLWYDSWLGKQNEQLWCFNFWKTSLDHGFWCWVVGFDGRDEEMPFWSKNLISVKYMVFLDI